MNTRRSRATTFSRNQRGLILSRALAQREKVVENPPFVVYSVIPHPIGARVRRPRSPFLHLGDLQQIRRAAEELQTTCAGCTNG